MALIVGNWKMNGLRSSLAEARRIAEGAPDGHDLAICPPATLLWAMSEALEGSAVKTGGQDCHPKESGAHTGRISAEMIADAGASYCIVGHSECREECGDTDDILAAKLAAVLRAGLVPIFCVGESLETREAGEAVSFVTAQLGVVMDLAEKVVVAYEPIWAIGTGKVPGVDDIAEMHQAMRDRLGETTPLLYGGSVKPGNASEILAVPHVGGALVGGASLKADDFLGIARAG
ncbi:triose-phosphate isomerase [Parvularcula lutaonensis]|uniref:Triosephosphate isomerase n=1 Tax=Parvularcula lutaonensis TaxID=491923 RepID=A0ABV7MBX0_9PROT|nr:triose-phosphate isomerase [Parvularcula lutaonensis]GGY49477.1 triosephosphate isomerase [Parvularcula lutaonensis]